MADMTKQVTLKIESPIHGHQELQMSVGQAISEIADQTGKQGKWLYCDGEFQPVDCATADGKSRLAESLANARDITLASTLVGG